MNTIWARSEPHSRIGQSFDETVVPLLRHVRAIAIRHMTKIWNDGISLKQLGWM